MTQERLKNYAPLKAEVDHLKTRQDEIIKTLEKDKTTGILKEIYTPLLNYYNELILKYSAELQAVESAINALPDWGRDVLTLRYIECKDWITISFDMYFSLTHTYRLHNKALALL